jgi:hypothetical protein
VDADKEADMKAFFVTTDTTIGFFVGADTAREARALAATNVKQRGLSEKVLTVRETKGRDAKRFLKEECIEYPS